MTYLYDKQGEGDADLVALEGRLASARYSGRKQPSRRRWPVVAAVAALAAAVLAFVLFPSGPAMSVTTASGSSSQLRVGRWFEPTEQSTITVADIGRVTVEPSSKVRIVETHAQRHRLELEQGRLHAKVTAPPRLFVVDTPAAQAVDLGCEYDLAVEADGATRLTVTLGEVSLEGAGVASRVSAGASARSVKGRAPGVPRSVRASAGLGAALDAFESGGPVEPVLEAAAAVDAVSLWNLLSRVEGAQRAAVLAKLSAVIGRESGDDAKLLALDPAALESLWESFP